MRLSVRHQGQKAQHGLCRVGFREVSGHIPMRITTAAPHPFWACPECQAPYISSFNPHVKAAWGWHPKCWRLLVPAYGRPETNWLTTNFCPAMSELQTTWAISLPCFIEEVTVCLCSTPPEAFAVSEPSLTIRHMCPGFVTWVPSLVTCSPGMSYKGSDTYYSNLKARNPSHVLWKH